MKLLIFALSVMFLAMSFSCQKDSGKDKPEKKRPTVEPTSNSANNSIAMSPGCDPELWKRVYNPSRLEVIEQCKEVTGVIDEIGKNEDGDTHMLIKLDPGQGDLLKKGNEKKKQGDLVAEVVCANEITAKKVKETCTGYTNNVQIPKVGDSVKVTGSYVVDSNNGWTEIHPVSKIELR